MDERLKQRLVGAAVLVSLAVIIAPMILDKPEETDAAWHTAEMPPPPEHVFRTEIEPVREAEILGRATKPDVGSGADRLPGGRPPDAAPQQGTASQRAVKSLSGGTADKSPGSGPGAWAVQLGSFSDSGNAVALRDRLRAKGYPAFIESVRVGEKDVKRVYVGPELLRAKAAESRKRLEQETQLKGMVVRYPAS